MFSCLPGWIFISDNTSHSNNQVNHYLQQIHEHYDAYYVQNDFGHIGVLTVWADNCSEQFKSRYQPGWSVLYVNKTSLQIIHLFFFCPQHGKGPPDGLGGNCKNAIKAEEKFRRHLPSAIDVFLWLQQNFTAVHSPGNCFVCNSEKNLSLCPKRNCSSPSHHRIHRICRDFKFLCVCSCQRCSHWKSMVPFLLL